MPLKRLILSLSFIVAKMQSSETTEIGLKPFLIEDEKMSIPENSHPGYVTANADSRHLDSSLLPQGYIPCPDINFGDPLRYGYIPLTRTSPKFSFNFAPNSGILDDPRFKNSCAIYLILKQDKDAPPFIPISSDDLVILAKGGTVTLNFNDTNSEVYYDISTLDGISIKKSSITVIQSNATEPSHFTNELTLTTRGINSLTNFENCLAPITASPTSGSPTIAPSNSPTRTKAPSQLTVRPTRRPTTATPTTMATTTPSYVTTISPVSKPEMPDNHNSVITIASVAAGLIGFYGLGAAVQTYRNRTAFDRFLKSILDDKFNQKNINLNNFNLTNQQLEQLIKALKSKPAIAERIESIDLSHNKLHTPPDLSIFPNLKSLSLANNKLQLAPDVSNNLLLESLNLENNKLVYAPDISKCSNLQKFLLSGNPLTAVTQREITSLRALRPGLETGIPANANNAAISMQELGAHFNSLAKQFFDSEYTMHLIFDAIKLEVTFKVIQDQVIQDQVSLVIPEDLRIANLAELNIPLKNLYHKLLKSQIDSFSAVFNEADKAALQNFIDSNEGLAKHVKQVEKHIITVKDNLTREDGVISKIKKRVYSNYKPKNKPKKRSSLLPASLRKDRALPDGGDVEMGIISKPPEESFPNPIFKKEFLTSSERSKKQTVTHPNPNPKDRQIVVLYDEENPRPKPGKRPT